MKKKAKGRPPKKFGVKRQHVIVRVTPKTKEAYERAAFEAELDFSDWVRSVLDAAAKSHLEPGPTEAAPKPEQKRK